MTFKKGDRVVVAAPEGGFRERKGLQGTVDHVSPGVTYPVYVKLDGRSLADPYRPAELEPVKPAPKFKVGDKVRRVRSHPKWSTGTVTRVNSNGGVEVLPDGPWRYPEGCARTDGAGTFSAVALELVQYAPGFTLRRGDRIVNTKTGRKGHVVEGQDEELWVVDHTYCEETGAPAKAVEEYEHHYPGTYEITNRKEGGPF